MYIVQCRFSGSLLHVFHSAPTWWHCDRVPSYRANLSWGHCTRWPDDWTDTVEPLTSDLKFQQSISFATYRCFCLKIACKIDFLEYHSKQEKLQPRDVSSSTTAYFLIQKVREGSRELAKSGTMGLWTKPYGVNQP